MKKRLSSLFLGMTLVLSSLPITAMAEEPVQSEGGGTEPLQIITPVKAGTAKDSQFFPLDRAFDGQPMLDENTGYPIGGTVGSTGGISYNGNRVGYIDFGEDWSKVRITSTWTQYMNAQGASSNQTPYIELWWDSDINTVNDSVYTEERINFNTGQNLSIGATPTWVIDYDASSDPVTPKARYLLARGPETMASRATEFAFVGWIDANGNGVQDTPGIAVNSITVTSETGAVKLTPGSTLQMSTEVMPATATNKAITWSVENGTGSATIDESGLLTAVSVGTVTVKATAQDASAVFGTMEITIENEILKVIRPASAGAADGSAFFPLDRAFDSQPELDEDSGGPVGDVVAEDAPSHSGRVGYIDFGPDWSKIRILSTWTQYRVSSGGNQIPFAELWWDNDNNTTNDSGYVEERINFNSAQGLSTGSTTPWIIDSDVSGSPVIPKARYLLAKAPDPMTNRAEEFAIIGWVDSNGNGIQDVPFTPVRDITVSAPSGMNSLLVNETLQMSAALVPYNATNKGYTWSVENGTGAATIDENGLLTALSQGTVTVKATSQDGAGVSDSMNIDISKYRQFILPVQGQSSIVLGDLQNTYPKVDWQTLERLYIPAGTYTQVKLGNLPQRTADNPLVITNYGGQVIVSGYGNYTMTMEGGAHWILTGKYDPELMTGHPDYVGHQFGNYANSDGTYGILVGRNDSNGLAVGNKATNFELSHMEVAHAGFAGLLIKSDNTPTATMDGVKIHDMYVHDAESEGMYIGNTNANINTQHIFTNLEVYNNRVLRSGTEGIQLTNMGDGTHVHHNVVVMNSLAWKNPFQIWQDGAFQYRQRTGSADIHDNIIIGAAGSLFSMGFGAGTEETPSADDEVRMYNNYFSHGRNTLAYIHNNPANTLSKFIFENNVIGPMQYQYGELPGDQENIGALFFASHNNSNPLIFSNNTHEAGKIFIDAIGGDNGTNASGNLIATGNTTLSSTNPIVFRDVTFPAGFDWYKVERWDDVSDLYGGPIYYEYGDYVYYFPTGALYVNIEEGSHTSKNPEQHPETWQLLAPAKEDYRLDPSSPYQGMGLTDGTPVPVDTTLPVIKTPEQLSFIQSDLVQMEIDATDSISGLHSLEVTFDGEAVGNPITFDPFQLNVGTYTIAVTATDRAGNSSTAEFQLEISIVPEDPAGATLKGPAVVSPGDTLALTYGIENVTSSVYAKSVTVHYDPLLLEYVEAEELTDSFSVVAESAKPGKVRLLAASTVPHSPITGSTELLNLRFRALHSDQTVHTSVYLSDVVIADGSGVESTLRSGPAHQVEITVAPADITALETLIAEAEATAARAALQASEALYGHYQASVIQAFLAAIADAKAVAASAGTGLTQADVDLAVASLAHAQQTLLSSANTGARLGDLGVMAAHYGMSAASVSSEAWTRIEMYDMDDSSVIDIVDLAHLAGMLLE